jgi:hypothetical protein
MVFTTLQWLCNLQIGPISWSICHWQVFPVMCFITLQLIRLVHKLQRKWRVVTVKLGLIKKLFFQPNHMVFVTLQWLCNLQMGPISWSVCHWQAFLVMCYIMLQLIGLMHKMPRKWWVVGVKLGLTKTLFLSAKSHRHPWFVQHGDALWRSLWCSAPRVPCVTDAP